MSAIRKNNDRYTMAAGMVSLSFFSLLAAYHILDDKPYLILWTCHMACLISGAGLVFKRPMMNAMGFLWLCFGVPLWLINVMTGDTLILLSIPTHIGGLFLSLWGVKRLGIPRHTWIIASAGLIVLGFISRWFTPFDANINLSHSIWKGYEAYYSSHATYVVFVSLIGMFVFAVLEFIAFRMCPHPTKNKG